MIIIYDGKPVEGKINRVLNTVSNPLTMAYNYFVITWKNGQKETEAENREMEAMS